jgi:hypothetical protein
MQTLNVIVLYKLNNSYTYEDITLMYEDTLKQLQVY